MNRGIPRPNSGLEVLNLSKNFQGVRALDDVTFHVEPGELVGLIGPNGSGKSTALDCICGQLRQDSGQVFVEGRPIHGRSHHLARRGVARTFQDGRVFESLTVVDNLALASISAMKGSRRWSALLQPLKARSILEPHEGLLSALGIDRFGSHRAGELSYGQRKLVDFAAAAIQNPTVLLLDEPVAAVSPVVIETIVAWLRHLSRSGVTVVLVEHDLELVQDLCDRVVVLDHGRKVADGDPREVMKKKEVHEAYFGV